MGMFDEVRFRGYPLPLQLSDDVLLQTKSLDCRMDLFEVREDGSLWREHYDIEDRSDPNAEGIMAIVGCMTRVNKRWQREPYTGEVSVTHWTGEPPLRVLKLWCRDGIVRDVALCQ
jgi:hypothetical protein